ncbi:MAG TPA: efflux RND transporter periplasmic adaptor subunit [Thermoanaerobaculia bacterium]|nr:efflux RND transporter periplasmic adaptor subunit [Thermoanaerobaculia bacterium]
MKSIFIRMSVLGLVALAFAGCRQEAPPTFERPPAPVAVAAVVTRDVPVYLDEVGKVAAREVVSVEPQLSGRITRIHFSDGAHLRKGDLLFTIDPRPFQAQLDAAEATLAQTKAALDLARIQFTRASTLIETKAVSQEEYDLKKNAIDVAAAQVEQSRAAVETAKLNLEYCFIRSPIDGRAGQRLVDTGNVVTANSGSLLTIQRLDPVYADFTVPENDLTAVQRNMARGSLQVEVRLPDEPGEPSDPRVGALTFLDNAVQDGTGTVKLRATIPNGDHRFWPGRFVKIRLVLDTLQEAVLVPAAAPQTSAQGPFVYVVKEDSTAEQRTVTPGQRQGDLMVISQGLKPGERIVVNGQLGVTPGGKVRIEGSAPGNNPGATAISSNIAPKKEGKS